MSDIKQFLRFGISGYIVILYTFLFIIALIDFKKIYLTKDILGISVSGFIVAAPLGYLMHQIDVYVFNQFKEKRWNGWGKERKSIKVLKEYIKTYSIFKNIKPQISLEIIKCLSDDNSKFNYSYFEKEISNRYSYYYSRVEASIFSPIFSVLIFIIIYYIISLNSKDFFVEINFSNDSVFSSRIPFIIFILIVIFVISILNFGYCRTILDEIDDMEYVFIRKNEDIIKKEFEDKYRDSKIVWLWNPKNRR